MRVISKSSGISVTSGAVVLALVSTFGGAANAATVTSRPTSSSVTQSSQYSPVKSTASVDNALRDEMVKSITSAKSSLKVGGSATVYQADGVKLVLTQPSEGRFVLQGNPGVMHPDGFCHAAAMAAVYTIGAAVFAAAALVGGIEVFGVFLAADAAGAMSVALTAGAGLSALVAVYIC